ncbi:MAG: hypothetical protein OEX77_05740 [Candidatus Bathyarchaeota archaeon]|nr:hypothetical protein [Candidatus Bathyarchaeota archaeon]
MEHLILSLLFGFYLYAHFEIGKNYQQETPTSNRAIMRKTMERKGRKRRDRLYIMAEILKIAKRKALKTQLMYGANLSFAQLNDYLGVLISTKLLKTIRKDNKLVYTTTSKGLEFLTNYEKIILLLGE